MDHPTRPRRKDRGWQTTVTEERDSNSTQGRFLLFSVYGGGSALQINHNSASSNQDNRFACANAANMTIQEGGSCISVWAANAAGNNRWQAVAIA